MLYECNKCEFKYSSKDLFWCNEQQRINYYVNDGWYCYICIKSFKIKYDNFTVEKFLKIVNFKTPYWI